MRRFARALGTHKAGKMNGLESEYSKRLELLKASGEIISWEFESVKLSIGKRCWYTPDFMVINRDREIEFHETKGYMMEDANVKLKAVADKFPFKFFLITKEKGSFKIKDMTCS